MALRNDYLYKIHMRNKPKASCTILLYIDIFYVILYIFLNLVLGEKVAICRTEYMPSLGWAISSVLLVFKHSQVPLNAITHHLTSNLLFSYMYQNWWPHCFHVTFHLSCSCPSICSSLPQTPSPLISSLHFYQLSQSPDITVVSSGNLEMTFYIH